MPTWHDVFAAGIDHSAAAGHDQIGAHLPAQSNIKHNQKKKTKKVPSRIQKILHLVSGTTRFHSNNSDSIFVNEKRFLRLFWFCFGYFFGFFFWFLRRVDCAIDSVLPDALDDAIFNVDVHVLDAVGVDHLAVSDQQPILGAL